MNDIENKEDHHINNGKTHRHYPQRDKFKNQQSITCDIYKSRNAYDSWSTSVLNKQAFKYMGCADPVRYEGYNCIWKFMNDVFNTNITPSDKFTDISYQDLADMSGCIVVVNKNNHFSFMKDIGETNKENPSYAGGSVQSVYYSQRGMIGAIPLEDAKLRKWYYPDTY